jgi:cytochrome b561
VQQRYGTVAIALHWLIAALVFCQIYLGWWMIEIPKYPVGVRASWFNLHKSIGLTIALLVVLRLAWRLRHPPPPLPAWLPRWQARAAGINHFLLYAALLLQPLAGYLGSSFSGYPIKYFGISVPGWGWESPALKELMSDVHLLLAWAVTILVLIHVAAALTHLVKRDGIFQRMLPRASAPAAAEAAQRAG